MDLELIVCGAIWMALGTVLHFAFDRLGRPWWLAPLMPVNESVWEHTKLLTVPVLLTVPLQSRLLAVPPRQLLEADLQALGAGLAAMVLLYYFWVGAIGPNSLWLGAGILGVSTAVCCGTLSVLLARGGTPLPWQMLLGALVVGYIFFTYAPPRLPLFRDSQTGTYGLE